MPTRGVRWRVWFDDQAPFSDLDGPPQEVPARGVQVIAQADPATGRFLLSRHDYYWWQGGRWWAGDSFGLWDYLCQPGWKRVLFGRSVPGERWNELMVAAEDDPDLPARSARDLREGWAP